MNGRPAPRARSPRARYVVAHVPAPSQEHDRRVHVEGVEALEPVRPRGQPVRARRVGDQEEPPALRGEPGAHRVPHPRPQPVRRVEEHHGDAADAEPRGLAPVTVQEARQVRRHARGAPAPELARLVVGRQDQARLAGVAEERGEAQRLLALAAPPGHQEAVQPRLSGQGQLGADPGGVPAVVRPARGVVGRADVESPGLRPRDGDRGSRGSAPGASRGARGSSVASGPSVLRASRTRDSGRRGRGAAGSGAAPWRHAGLATRRA